MSLPLTSSSPSALRAAFLAPEEANRLLLVAGKDPDLVRSPSALIATFPVGHFYPEEPVSALATNFPS